MKCPICDIEMRISDREGVEIDYCTQCRGVWLDRGELEKIIARVESQADGDRRQDDDRDEDRVSNRRRQTESSRDDDYKRRDSDYRGGRKREGMLSNLFDLFGD